MEYTREIMRLLKPHLRRYGGPTTVFRGEKVRYSSKSRGSTFWSASITAADTYSGGGYGWFTTATFFVGTHVYFEIGGLSEFRQFCDKLAGCNLIYTTTDEWTKSITGRVSYPGDFYTYCVDHLIDAKVWPRAVRYTIFGDDWSLSATTHRAAEMIVHNRAQLIMYKQEEPCNMIIKRVDCWRKKKIAFEENGWNRPINCGII